MKRMGSVGVAAAALWIALPIAAAGQQTPVRGARTLTLEEALSLAQESSEQVTIARSEIQRTRGEQYRARSEYLPQLFGSASYTRTLKSEFSGLGSDDESGGEPCRAFNPNKLAPLSERVDSLESALACRDDENPFGDLFSDLPFGRENQFNLGLSVSQNVFTGGRLRAQSRIASANRQVADIGMASTQAQLVLTVAQAYYDAVLSDRLFTIAEATMAQTETTLSQVKVAYQVGQQPEFELLRAQVARDNERPVVIQRRADRDLAYIRLKQLLNLPLDESLELTTGLGMTEPTALTVTATVSDTAVAQRAPVRQAAEGVRVQESLVTIARAQRLPSLSVSSAYGRVAYPGDIAPSWGQFRTNWTVTASVEVPLFTGGRIRGDEMVAEANALAARARLQETREAAALDTRDAIEALRAAEASWVASGGTVEQATRAHSIAEVRYREGISTQLELDDARILLQQAQANRAIAARDLQVARVRLALLPDLPLGATLGIQAINQAAVGAAIQPQQQLVPRITRQPQQSRPGVPVQASRVRN